jgi:hypothetical protein
VRKTNSNGKGRIYKDYVRLAPVFYKKRGPHEDGTTPDGQNNANVCSKAAAVNKSWYGSKELTKGFRVIDA